MNMNIITGLLLKFNNLCGPGQIREQRILLEAPGHNGKLCEGLSLPSPVTLVDEGRADMGITPPNHRSPGGISGRRLRTIVWSAARKTLKKPASYGIKTHYRDDLVIYFSTGILWDWNRMLFNTVLKQQVFAGIVPSLPGEMVTWGIRGLCQCKIQTMS